MYGPITLTVGQPFSIALPAETKYIDIQNDSMNDVWVYFGNTKPTDLTNANNTWHRAVRRQHDSLIPVEGFRGASAYERSNNAVAAFQGIVWLLAVNPAGLAQTGTVSGRSQVYVTPYQPGDPTPAHTALATQVDLTSQPRVIALPSGPGASGTVLWDPTGSPTFLWMLLQANPTAAQIAANAIPVYLHSLLAMSESGTTAMRWAVEVCSVNNLNVNIGTPLVLLQAYASGTTPVSYCPAVPQEGFTSATVNVASVAVYLVYLAGTKGVMDVSANVTNDLINAFGIPAIGAGQVAVSLGVNQTF